MLYNEQHRLVGLLRTHPLEELEERQKYNVGCTAMSGALGMCSQMVTHHHPASLNGTSALRHVHLHATRPSPHPLLHKPGGVGRWNNPQGPIWSLVTIAAGSPGAEPPLGASPALGAPALVLLGQGSAQDLLSTGTPPASRALIAAPPVPL